MFRIEINTGGAAFRDEDGNLDLEGNELRRILNYVSTHISHGYTDGVVIDINGNKCGSWEITDD